MNNWQRDPRWRNTLLGFSNTTIGDFGCTISAIGNIVGATPVQVNDKLKAVKGFANGNLVIWSKIQEAFPNFTVTRKYGYDNNDVLKHLPNVIVEVDGSAIGGRGKHWIQYIGDKKCKDPWTGKVRPTSDFSVPSGYTLIIPKNVPPPVVTPPVTPPQGGGDTMDEKVSVIDVIKAVYRKMIGREIPEEDLKVELNKKPFRVEDMIGRFMSQDFYNLYGLKSNAEYSVLEDKNKQLSGQLDVANRTLEKHTTFFQKLALELNSTQEPDDILKEFLAHKDEAENSAKYEKDYRLFKDAIEEKTGIEIINDESKFVALAALDNLTPPTVDKTLLFTIPLPGLKIKVFKRD